jgi:selenocysteine lyase/cysteine desulfurase
LIRTSFPTSHGYQYPGSVEPIRKTPFVHLFEFVATIDYTPYLCVPAAIEFRQKICGGESAIRDYCYELARVGGQSVADCLGTEVMGNKSGSLSKCCFANVKLPFIIGDHDGLLDSNLENSIRPADVGKLLKWFNITAVKEFDTYLQMGFHSGYIWVRLSGQVYLDLKDFEWVGPKLKELCERGRNGEFQT